MSGLVHPLKDNQKLAVDPRGNREAMQLLSQQFGMVSAAGVAMRFSGAYEQDDTSEVSAVEIVVRGRHETIEMGDATPGEDTEHSITTTCSYYKLTVDNEDIIEIDLLNFIEKVGGVDMLEKQRNALGF